MNANTIPAFQTTARIINTADTTRCCTASCPRRSRWHWRWAHARRRSAATWTTSPARGSRTPLVLCAQMMMSEACSVQSSITLRRCDRSGTPVIELCPHPSSLITAEGHAFLESRNVNRPAFLADDAIEQLAREIHPQVSSQGRRSAEWLHEMPGQTPDVLSLCAETRSGECAPSAAKCLWPGPWQLSQSMPLSARVARVRGAP